MIYAHSTPPEIVWTVAGSDTSPSFATDVRLDNGQPAEVSVIVGVGSSSPAIGHYIDLRATWPTAAAVWVASLLRMSIPAGVRVDVTGRRPADGGFTYALGGNSVSERTRALPDGRVQHLVIGAEPTDGLIGLQWRIYNDRNGATWAMDSTEARIGEGRPWEAVVIERAFARRRRGRSRGKQINFGFDAGVAVVARPERRALAFDIGGTQPSYYGAGLGQGLDYEQLEALADSESHRCLAIPRRFDHTGAFDPELVHRTAIFGVAQFGDIQHPSATGCRGSVAIEEVL